GGMTWHDSRDQQLEHQLGAVVETMLTVSKAAQERLKQAAIEAKRRAEAERRRYEEELRVKRLEKQLDAWKRAEEVRAYTATVEAAIVKKHGNVDAESELGQWLAWMRNYADRLDPSHRDDLAREPQYVW